MSEKKAFPPSDLRPVEIYQTAIGEYLPLSVVLARVSAGFPSPADDFVEKKLDLNELVVSHPVATFFVRVEGESMIDAGIHAGDILVVDRSLEAKHGKIVIAVVDGEFTVKRLLIDDEGVTLVPENSTHKSLKISEESDFQVWGVVTYVIHQAR